MELAIIIGSIAIAIGIANMNFKGRKKYRISYEGLEIEAPTMCEAQELYNWVLPDDPPE